MQIPSQPIELAVLGALLKGFGLLAIFIVGSPSIINKGG